MSDLHKFLFAGQPVRGAHVRLTDGWQEVLRRRADAGSWSPGVRSMLGEMTAAALLLQSSLNFDGALVLQVQGDGPVRLAVAEASSDLKFRVTAKIVGEVPAGASFQQTVNAGGQARCAVTLDPHERPSGQSLYQGVVPLTEADGRPVAGVASMLELYMRQSEQLETRLVLAADDQVAAGLLLQRMPVEGTGNLAHLANLADLQKAAIDDDSFRRIGMLAATLTPQELLSHDVSTLLHKLFWQEPLRLYEPREPAFACSCSRERVRSMLHQLGEEEARSILAERGDIEIGCDFCGAVYRFDSIDVAGVFTVVYDAPSGDTGVH